MAYLSLLNIALLQNLHYHVFLLVCSELVIQSTVGGCVEHALSSVPGGACQTQQEEYRLFHKTYLCVTKTFQPLTT